jgi:hypothetical protein
MEKNEKICPFLKHKCVKGACGMFNDKFHRCDVGLLAYNLYLFADAVRDLKLTFAVTEKNVPQNENETEGTIENLMNL